MHVLEVLKSWKRYEYPRDGDCGTANTAKRTYFQREKQLGVGIDDLLLLVERGNLPDEPVCGLLSKMNGK